MEHENGNENGKTTKALSPDGALPARTDGALYTGLSERTKRWVIGLGATVAVINLFAAWWFAYGTSQSFALTDESFKPFAAWIKNSSAAGLSKEAQYDLSARAMHIVAMGKLVTNKQGIILACFGAAFALAAIGFSLFILGADGAFKVIADAPNKASIAVTGTAPGLLCFLVCGWLVTVGVKHQSQLTLPPMRYETSSSPSTSHAACAHRNPSTNECE
jgi:hypothetical protein